MCEYMVLEDFNMDKYIYDNSNGLWYEMQGNYYIPCLVLPTKKKNDISAYGDIGICGIFGSIKRYFFHTE